MLSRLIRVQVDSTDEIVKEFNVLIDNCNLMETKICQLSHEVEALKPKVVPKLEDLPLPKAKKPKIKLPKKEKKKGRTMKKKGIAITRVLAILMLVVAIGYTGVAYAQYRPTDITYDIVSNPTMLTTYLRDVTLNMASDSYLFNPRAAAPQAALGRIYYNSGANEWVGYNGAWTTFAVAAGGSLNAAYGVGDTITADDGQVVINTTDADANPSLAINHSGGAAGDGLLVTVSGAFNKDAIEIENTANGYDIEGTGATWFVTKGGALTVTALDSTGATGITLENDETITNADGDITFTDSGTGEDFSIDLNAGGNVVTFKSATGIDELAFGAVDDLSGVATIVFDDAATSAISMTGTGTNNLTITQLGVGNESLVLNSDGNPVDAVTIAATAGGIDVDSALSIVLTSTENQPDSIVLQSTLGGIDIVADASGGEDINITNTGGSIVASASQIATDAITIVGTAGGIDMDAVDDINIAVASTAAADDLALVQTGGVNASITLAAAGTGADAIDLNASAGGIDIDAALGVTIDNAGAASNIAIASAAGSLNLAGGEAALDAVTITSGGGIDIDAVDDVDFILTAGAAGEDFTIQCTGVQDTTLSLLSSGTEANAIEIITTAGGIDITNVGSAVGEDVDISSNRAVNITSSEAADLAITIVTSNAAGNIQIQSADGTADAIDINTTAGGIDIDMTGAAADEDFSITTDSSINLVTSEAVANQFLVDATGVVGGYAVNIGTTDGAITLDADGVVWGDIMLDAVESLTLFHGGSLYFGGAATELWVIDGTGGGSATTISFTDPTANITWTFPDGDTGVYGVMQTSLATNFADENNSVTGGTSQLIFEGATGGDAHESIIQATDPGADIIWILPDGLTDSLAFMGSTMVTNYPEIVDSVWFEANTVVFEDTADGFETRILASDPLEDITWTIPSIATTQTVAFMSTTLATNIPEAANSVTGGTNALIWEGAGVDAHETTITSADVTADMDWVLPLAAATQDLSFMSSTLLTNMVDTTNSVTGGTNSLIFEGAGVDNFETTITSADVTADMDWVLPLAVLTQDLSFMSSTLLTNQVDVANSIWGGTNELYFEGATINTEETVITATDPTADIIWTLPDGAAGTYGFMSTSLATNFVDIADSVTGGSDEIIFEGSDADTEETIIRATDPTADIIWILPDGGADSVAFMGSTMITNYPEVVDSVWFEANTIVFEDAADLEETRVTATDPLEDIVWWIPTMAAADDVAVAFMASTLLTNYPSVANSVTGAANQLIFEGTADTEETIIQANDATTADAVIELPNDSGDIVYAPNGAVDYSAGAGALPITHVQITYESSGGAEAITLGNGVPGQILQINHDVDGGNGVLTPDTATGWTSVDLADDGDMITLLWVDTVGWIIIGTAGNAAPPVVTP